MLSTTDTARLPYWTRLSRARARSYLRWQRRIRRSAHLWARFRDHYDKQPHLSSELWIHDEWTGQRCRWSYEESVHLEDQAYILWNRLRHWR